MILRSVLLIAISALLIGAYVAFRPSSPVDPSPDAGAKEFSLAIADQVGADGVPVFNVEQGDLVRLQISSEVEGGLAVHGYPVEIPLSLTQPVMLEFSAAHTGRFPIHVHSEDGAHLDAGVLQVEPRASASR